MSSQDDRSVKRQVKLPISKAVEIAWKSIRMRLSRSLLVTSGIVLALAFLVSILITDVVIAGMRDWIQDEKKETPERTELRDRQEELDTQIAPLRYELARLTPEAPEGTKQSVIEDKQEELLDIARDGDPPLVLPQAAPQMAKALLGNDGAQEKFDQWVELARERRELNRRITAPEILEARLQAAGHPTTAEEVDDANTQTNWLIALALLVAFVGILNAMLMSVTERFREIGTMKCLGALDGFIIKLFLIESLFQGVVGTVLGLALGV